MRLFVSYKLLKSIPPWIIITPKMIKYCTPILPHLIFLPHILLQYNEYYEILESLE